MQRNNAVIKCGFQYKARKAKGQHSMQESSFQVDFKSIFMSSRKKFKDQKRISFIFFYPFSFHPFCHLQLRSSFKLETRPGGCQVLDICIHTCIHTPYSYSGENSHLSSQCVLCDPEWWPSQFPLGEGVGSDDSQGFKLSAKEVTVGATGSGLEEDQQRGGWGVVWIAGGCGNKPGRRDRPGIVDMADLSSSSYTQWSLSNLSANLY